MEEIEKTNEEILWDALNAAIKAFGEAASEYDLYIGYDFKAKLYPSFSEDDKKIKPMLEISANNEGNFI